LTTSSQVGQAIRTLNTQLADLALPEETDLMTELVVQQQQLLESYFRSCEPDQIDRVLIAEVIAENTRQRDTACIAHSDAAKELDALTLGRNAVFAYQDSQLTEA